MRPMALTMGDPAGIGPEIVVKALYEWQKAGATPVWVAGSSALLHKALAHHCKRLQTAPKPFFAVSSAQQATQQLLVTPHAFVVLDDGVEVGDVAMGVVSAAAGAAAARAISCAAQACLAGHVSAVITAPIHKLALHAAGVEFPGHTEMLQTAAAKHLGVPIADVPVRMLLANPELQTVLLSIHVSLRQALELVTVDNLLQTLLLTNQWVPCLRGTGPLRIAVAGVNPHAGEGGRFGREEIDIMAPAIYAARKLGLQVSDPLSPDTVYMRARAGEFDVVVAAYHDQGLIPVKYLGVADGVNVTLGLPFVRTSPDHGTAFDIAGLGVADASSLLQAMSWADASAKRQCVS